MKAIKIKGKGQGHGVHLPIHATAESVEPYHGSNINTPIDTVSEYMLQNSIQNSQRL